MCEEKVTQNGDFDVESCVEVFRFAEIRDANFLKKHCLDFMAKRADALINTPSIASKIDAALLQGTFYKWKFPRNFRNLFSIGTCNCGDLQKADEYLAF